MNKKFLVGLMALGLIGIFTSPSYAVSENNEISEIQKITNEMNVLKMKLYKLFSTQSASLPESEKQLFNEIGSYVTTDKKIYGVNDTINVELFIMNYDPNQVSIPLTSINGTSLSEIESVDRVDIEFIQILPYRHNLEKWTCYKSNILTHSSWSFVFPQINVYFDYDMKLCPFTIYNNGTVFVSYEITGNELPGLYEIKAEYEKDEIIHHPYRGGIHREIIEIEPFTQFIIK